MGFLDPKSGGRRRHELQLLLLVATLIFGYVGVRQLRESWQYGMPSAWAFDSLIMAQLCAIVLGISLWRSRGRRD